MNPRGVLIIAYIGHVDSSKETLRAALGRITPTTIVDTLKSLEETSLPDFPEAWDKARMMPTSGSAEFLKNPKRRWKLVKHLPKQKGRTRK